VYIGAKKEIVMKRSALIAAWLAVAAVAVSTQGPSKPDTAPVLDNKRLILQAENVAPNGTTSVFGDPARPGTYILRTLLAPNTKTRPRFHDQDRWVTVLKGTWWVGEGEVFSPDKVTPVREGGLMFQPANMRTFDITGSSEVVLQIVGNGPVRTTHAEVDAAGLPVPVGGPYPEDAVEGGGRRRGRRGAPPPLVPARPAQDPDDPDQNPKPVRQPS
jgi:hypothetical protein